MPHRIANKLRQWRILVALVTLLGQTCWPVGTASASEPQPAATKQDESPAASETAPPRSGQQLQAPSEAESIARLQRVIEADRKQLAELVSEQDDPQNEYFRAQAAFEQIDAKRADLLDGISELEAAGRRREARELERNAEALQPDWERAKARFELMIRERKALGEKIVSLREKIRQDQQAFELLTQPVRPRAEEMAPEAPPAAEKPADEADPPTEPKDPLRIPSPLDHLDTAKEAIEARKRRPPTEALLQAKEEAARKLEEAEQAEDRAKSTAQRFAALEEMIAIEEDLLTLARDRADQAQKEWEALQQEMHATLREEPAKLPEAMQQVDTAAKRFADERQRSRASARRVSELHNQLAAVQQEKLVALEEAKVKQEAAEAARGIVERLQFPFTPTNILQWLLDHGPKLLAILIGTLALFVFVKVSGRHMARVMAHGGTRGTFHERENRALTLVGVFQNAASLVVLGGGALMLLDAAGIPIMPLMGGAAVLGLAVAFGAQNLVKDYFSGFMVLLEDQYGIGDVVRIGNTSGVVEQISLRVTVLRDLEGVAHFIPHGTITTVSNMTHGWSRVLLEIGVAYKEDADRVMTVMMEVARQLRKDPDFGPLILADPEMLGVDNLADSAVLIRMTVKTQPIKQWSVRRELLRRIKRRFDELGIEIPFPHRTVFLRREDGGNPSAEPPLRERRLT